MADGKHLPRFHGIDLIRLLSFFAIAIFHLSYVHYFTSDVPISSEAPVIAVVETYARLLSFSGFTVLFLTSFLTAYAGKGLHKRIGLFSFLFFGWAIFSALMTGSGNLLLTWDIYPLIFFGILTSTTAELWSPTRSRVLGGVGFVMLLIPFWQITKPHWISPETAAVLGFGQCDRQAIEWPLMPWLGLVWGGYAVGQVVREKIAAQRWDALRMTNPEACLWGLLLIGSLPQWGAFYHIRLGPHFACDAYRQPPLIWWSHLIWVFFAVRLSFEPRIASRLAQWRICRTVSDLAISRRFWVAYFVSYLWSYAVSELGTATQWEETAWRIEASSIVCVAYVVSLEYVTRYCLALGRVLYRGALYLEAKAMRRTKSPQQRGVL